MKIKGKVIKGKGEGRKLGFPTANVLLAEKIPSGIFSAEVFFEGKVYQSAVFVSPDNNFLEAHIFDFTGDLYGQEIEVLIKDKIRDIVPFESDEQMKALIADDIKKILFMKQ